MTEQEMACKLLGLALMLLGCYNGAFAALDYLLGLGE